jgi:rhodanese-related sulfurtransferase
MMLRRIFGAAPAADDTIGVVEAQRKVAAREAVMVDVREPGEWQAGHVADARHIPLGELAARLDELPRDQELLLFCRSGVRSDRATQFLRSQGYTQARNVTGGIIAWAQHGLPLTQPGQTDEPAS